MIGICKMTMGIRKIKRLGTGVKQITSHDEIEEFKRVNLIYGPNGSGKTTLSRLIEKETSETGKGDAIEWYDQKPDHVFIFNGDFVNEHVYDGTAGKLSNDKVNVSATLFSTPETKAADEKIKVVDDELKYIGDLEKEMEKIYDSIKKEPCATFRAKTTEGKERKNFTNLPSYKELVGKKLPEKTREDIEADLEKKWSEYECSRSPTFDDDKGAVSNFNLQQLSLVDGEKILKCLSFDFAYGQKEALKNRMSAYEGVKLTQCGSLQHWFQSGLALLEQAWNRGDKKCPTCGSEFEESLLKEYRVYFSEQLRELQVNLGQLSDTFDRAAEGIDANTKQCDKIQHIIDNKQYERKNLKGAIEKLQTSEKCLKAEIERVRNLIKNKRDDSAVKYGEDEADIEKLIVSVREYNTCISGVSKAKEDFEKVNFAKNEDYIEQIKQYYRDLVICLFDDDEEIKKKIDEHCEKFYKDNKKPDGNLSFMASLKDRKSTLEKIKGVTEDNRREILKKYNPFVKSMNKFLERLGFYNFEIQINDDGFKVIYSECKQEYSGHNTLSEGEKTALALVYFLTKYELECKENNRGKSLVILDDIVTKMDGDHVHSACCLLIDVFGLKKEDKEKMVGQIFILSHYMRFLYIMSTTLRIGKDDGGRQSYELSKKEIKNLPVYMKNFDALYVESVIMLNDCIEGNNSHGRPEHWVPNKIRIVLESFFSFHFLHKVMNNLSDPKNNSNDYKTLSLGTYKQYLSKENQDKITDIENVVNRSLHVTGGSAMSGERASEQELERVVKLTFGVMESIAPCCVKLLTESQGQKDVKDNVVETV